MKRTIRLTENELHDFITESVKSILCELEVPNQINRSDRMQVAVDNGNNLEWATQYLAQEKTYYGYIAKLAQSNNTSYTKEISELQKKVTYYLTQGYFGKNDEVVTTIKRFSELLSYMHGLYEAALSRVAKRKKLYPESLMLEDSWLQRIPGYITHKSTNKYGVNQRPNDKSGNQYAVQQSNGQWMVDLQNQLKQFLKWNFLHGQKTIEATEMFIEFLNVEKRGIFVWTPRKKQALNAMKKALIGIAAVGAMLSFMGDGKTAGNMSNQQIAPSHNIEVVQQKQQPVNVSFAINKYQLSQEDIQQIQSLPKGNYKIVVHNTQNKSGKDAWYENDLAQNRANAIMKHMQGSHVTYERGENVVSNQAVVDIIPM